MTRSLIQAWRGRGPESGRNSRQPAVGGGGSPSVTAVTLPWRSGWASWLQLDGPRPTDPQGRGGGCCDTAGWGAEVLGCRALPPSSWPRPRKLIPAPWGGQARRARPELGQGLCYSRTFPTAEEAPGLPLPPPPRLLRMRSLFSLPPNCRGAKYQKVQARVVILWCYPFLVSHILPVTAFKQPPPPISPQPLPQPGT